MSRVRGAMSRVRLRNPVLKYSARVVMLLVLLKENFSRVQGPRAGSLLLFAALREVLVRDEDEQAITQACARGNPGVIREAPPRYEVHNSGEDCHWQNV
jgi:hypothetical protein